MPLSSVVGASSILKPGVCTSTTRPAAPFEGQTIYETDTDTMRVWNGSAWRLFAEVGSSVNGNIIQVVSTTKTDTFTMNSSTFSDITGLTATITPSSTSSKIFITATLTGTGQSGATIGHLRFARGGTAIGVGDASGNRIQGIGYLNAEDRPRTLGISFMDSPSSTSSLTYSVQTRNEGNANTVYINRGTSDSNDALWPRTSSTITVMEISA